MENILQKSISFGTVDKPLYLGVDSDKDNIWFTDRETDSKTTTGNYNTAIGTESLKDLTLGTSNTAIGSYSGGSLTEGNNNSFLGGSAGYSNTTGSFNNFMGVSAGDSNSTSNHNTYIRSWAGFKGVSFKNTILGSHAGYSNTSGSLNLILGYKAAQTSVLGDRNIILGTAAGNGVTGSNNVLIGNAAGVNGGDISNKLIIHNNHTYSGYSNTGDGNFTTPQVSYLQNALISGDFKDKTVKLNSSLQVALLPDVTGDISFEKNVVSKPDGTFGLASKPYKVYTSLLDFNQTTFEPLIRVLENSLVGDIVWTKLGVGQYEGKLAGGFVRNKTWIHVGENQFGEKAYCIYLDNNTVLLNIVNIGGDSIDAGGMFGILEIRVY